MAGAECDVAELFAALESHRPARAAEARGRLGDLLQGVKESWLVQGLVHYYLSTGSLRAADVLARTPAPHERHLLAQLQDGLRAPWRTEALALLGHLVRRQPLWLHTLCRCPVFRDLLHLLKTERDIVPLMSGLLVLITLLPMIPTLISPFFQEIFDVFGRLAAWEHRRSDASSCDGHREHLQLALYALFQNLYGMFPCNFVDFLKREYGKKENGEVFTHTVKPMLESVKVHPLLITASKNAETDVARWKKMEHHDVLVECRRFSSESARKQRGVDEDPRFRSRCGTDVSLLASDAAHFRSSKASNSTPNLAREAPGPEPGGAVWFSLAEACGSAPSAPATPLERGGGSPPEAAVEATPENTPVKDSRRRFDFPADSPVVRALGRRGGAAPAPASGSQPPSPLKKESSPFGRTSSTDGSVEPRADGFHGQNRLNRVLQERAPRGPDGADSGPSPRKRDVGSPLKKAAAKNLGASAPTSPGPSAESGLSFDVDPAGLDDREDVEAARNGDPDARPPASARPADRDDGEERWAEDEMTCVGEDPRCAERRHGLHMPPSTSMIGLVRRVARNRFHSQCVVEPTTVPAPKSSSADRGESGRSRRSSCPEFATGGIVEASTKPTPVVVENGRVENGRAELERGSRTRGTQTVEVWPLTYEHMFTDILQNVCDQSSKACDGSAPEDRADADCSPYRQIDRYVEVLTRSSDDRKSSADETDNLKRQLELLHLELLYERHRREVHAVRNRRLLGRSRKNRAAEEQNLALKQQISFLQTEVDVLHRQIGKQKRDALNAERKRAETDKYWQSRLSLCDSKIEAERQKSADLAARLLERRDDADESSGDVQNLRASLFDVTQQLQRAARKSEMGERQQEFVKRMQRELVICGERDAKYKEALLSLPSKTDALVNKTTQQYREQLVNAQTLLQQQTSKLDLLQGREAELESIVSSKETAAQELKRQLRLVKEEYSEKLKSAEDKYQSVKRINQRLEAHCLELLQRVPQSPQTISRDLTSGFSPQSSPLSASLASSEGHGPLLSRVDEMRNLQVIVNAHETIEESTSRSVNDIAPDDDAP